VIGARGPGQAPPAHSWLSAKRRSVEAGKGSGISHQCLDDLPELGVGAREALGVPPRSGLKDAIEGVQRSADINRSRHREVVSLTPNELLM
jgi:hypothetical protein